MDNTTIKLGIVGVGKIVRDQHLPAIEANPNIELIATASRSGSVEGIPAYLSIEEMVAATPELDAVAMCMPPQYRFAYARFALENGLHTLLEKPPGGTVSEVEYLHTLAQSNRKTLFATWHSRHASAVATAKQLLQERSVQSIALNWKESVRKWSGRLQHSRLLDLVRRRRRLHHRLAIRKSGGRSRLHVVERHISSSG